MTETHVLAVLLFVAVMVSGLLIGVAFALQARVRANRRAAGLRDAGSTVPTQAEFYRGLMRH